MKSSYNKKKIKKSGKKSEKNTKTEKIQKILEFFENPYNLFGSEQPFGFLYIKNKNPTIENAM